MTTDELNEYYQNLLIMQYALQPNALATIQAYVAQVIADQIVAQVRDGFNLPYTVGGQSDTAVGVQLDAVATYVGANRQVFGVDISRSNFLMPLYGDPNADTAPGFGVYGSPVTWFFLTYQDENLPIYTMNDSELTRVTQFRARMLSMFMSIENIDNLIFDFFGDNAAVFESGLMAITYLFLTSDPDSLSTLLTDTNSLPRPAGVKLTVIHTDSISGMFGFQEYSQAHNNTFVGFGLYGAPQPAAFLRYE